VRALLYMQRGQGIEVRDTIHECDHIGPLPKYSSSLARADHVQRKYQPTHERSKEDGMN